MKSLKWTLVLIPVAGLLYWVVAEDEPIRSDIELTKNVMSPVSNQANNPFQTKTSQTNSSITNAAPAAVAATSNGQTTTLSPETHAQRETLTQELAELRNCKQTASCPIDDSDPRASSFLLAKQLSEKLQRYAELHSSNQYYDQQTAQITQDYLTYPDGHVQSAALDLMQEQAPNTESAKVLIDALQSSYDGKLMKQAMEELQRYPELEAAITELFTNHLQTGAFNLAQELAKNIDDFIHANNIEQYKALADSLPPRSAKSKYLKSAILEAEFGLTEVNP
ncbi:hypothetical protein L0668_06850 [Paraglaciecola aquimarina]|uniref:Uncharacterized protein n=1 Tax=Paraglaciecola algarum TaxID=3050085 RepID=A0ABS9D4D6_9ALTE|nr:hypothetical protein [Paraglaciecola sp. G1-23]MCF2947817.1 hypothetical protein [Paraglaciecola sp. G1-23]